MNGIYFKNPTFPDENNNTNESNEIVGIVNNNLPMEQSYIENILRLNKGKHGKAYVSFPDSINWKDKIFDGVILQAGKDHLIMGIDDQTILIPLIYLDYFEFNGSIIYKPSELTK